MPAPAGVTIRMKSEKRGFLDANSIEISTAPSSSGGAAYNIKKVKRAV
jgi:hypothetical protein